MSLHASSESVCDRIQTSYTEVDPITGNGRSEGLTPNGIFGPWAWWSRALARWESCWDAAAAVSRKLGSETVLVFGPESVSYERSRHENWSLLREISARVFFVKIPQIKKNHVSNISRISGKWKTSISNISRRPKYRKTVIFNISRIMDNVADSNFQYFQACNNWF